MLEGETVSDMIFGLIILTPLFWLRQIGHTSTEIVACMAYEKKVERGKAAT